LLLGEGQVVGIQAGLLAVVADVFHGGPVQVADQCDVVMSFGHGLFIHAEPGDDAWLLGPLPPRDRPFHDVPGFVPTEAEQPGGAQDVGLEQDINRMPLEGDGGPRAGCRPGDVDLSDAVLSIAGDFDPAETRALVAKYFGGIPAGRGTPALPDMTVAATFGGWKRLVVEDEVMLPRLFLAFRSPVFGSEQYYAASVCSAILGLRKGSRLYRRLVRDRQVAAEAQAFTYDLTKGSDLLVVDVTARPSVSAEALEREVADEMDLLFRDGVTEDEVARAIALIQTEFVAAMQSAGDRADRLSMFATYFKDPELANEQVQKYEAVTADDVNEFIRERMGEDNRASLLFVPREESDVTAAPSEEIVAGVGSVVPR